MTRVGELYYKTEAYSIPGIRKENQWGLRTSIHSRGSFMKMDKAQEDS